MLIVFPGTGKTKWALKPLITNCKYMLLHCLPVETFKHLFAFGATFCDFSGNLERALPFRASFEENAGLKHISTNKAQKKSTMS